MKKKCNNPNTKRPRTPTNPSSFLIRSSRSSYLLSCMCLINVLLSCNVRCRVECFFSVQNELELVNNFSPQIWVRPSRTLRPVHAAICHQMSLWFWLQEFFPSHNMRTLFNQEHIGETAIILESFWLSLVHQTILLRGLFPVAANCWHFRRKPIFSASQKKS